ncbi:hypothetical protein GCM10020254_52560 [Streptomyces goshikiensis]
MSVALDALAVGVVLAGRRGVDEVEARAEGTDEVDGVALVEAEGVAGLGVLVDAGHVESGTVIAHAGAALAAERVQQPQRAASRDVGVLSHAGGSPVSAKGRRAGAVAVLW